VPVVLPPILSLVGALREVRVGGAGGSVLVRPGRLPLAAMTGTTPVVPPLDASLLNGTAPTGSGAALKSGLPPGKSIPSVPLTTPTSVLGGDGLSDSPVAASPVSPPAADGNGAAGAGTGANGSAGCGSANAAAPAASTSPSSSAPPLAGIIHSVVPTVRPPSGGGPSGAASSINSPRGAGSPRRSALVRLFSASPKSGGGAAAVLPASDAGAADEEDEEDGEDSEGMDVAIARQARLFFCSFGLVMFVGRPCLVFSCLGPLSARTRGHGLTLLPRCTLALSLSIARLLLACGVLGLAGLKKKKTLLHRLFHRLLKRQPLDAASPAPSAPLSVSDSSLMAQLLALPPTFTPASPLLPPAVGSLAARPTLVLDLDETLVHSSFTYLADAHLTLQLTISGEPAVAYVRKRPRVDEFLAAVADIFEVVVFTASLALYADPVLDELSASAAAINGAHPADMIHGRLYREHCVMVGGVFVKDLTRLGRDVKQVIIVDNSPISYAMQPENAVHILDFIDDETDGELDKTLAKVLTMRDVPDVRNVIRPPPKQAPNASSEGSAVGDKPSRSSVAPPPPLLAMQMNNGTRTGSVPPGTDVVGVTSPQAAGSANSSATPPSAPESGAADSAADPPASEGVLVAAAAGRAASADDSGDAMSSVVAGPPVSVQAPASAPKAKAHADALVPGTPVTPSGPFSDASAAMQT